MLGVHQEKRAPFSLARSHAPDLPQRRRSARVKLRWRCAALRAPLHCAPFLRPAGRATRGSGKKAFGHPFPQGRGENDLFWHQFSGQSRLKEGLVCPGRCQPSALKKSRFFVLPSEPLYLFEFGKSLRMALRLAIRAFFSQIVSKLGSRCAWAGRGRAGGRGAKGATAVRRGWDRCSDPRM